MLTTAILILLGALLVFVLWQMMRGSKGPGGTVTALPSGGRPAISGPVAEISQARPGDVISIHGAAEDFSDIDFTVEERNLYEGASHRWVGLSGDFRGTRISLEVSSGAGSAVIGTLDDRRIALPEAGLTEDQLAGFDAQQDPSASIQFDGKRWLYESSRELSFLQNEQEPAKGLYRWLFAEHGGTRMLRIEKWEGEPFDVRLARKLNPQDITVYRAA